MITIGVRIELTGPRRILATVITIVLMCSDALVGQPPKTFLEGARCSACPWSIAEPISVVNHTRDSLLWFGRIATAVATTSGDVAVLDRFRMQVILVDVDALSSVSVGRSGRGPGEFYRPARLAPMPAGSLLVYDAGLNRLSVVDPAGNVARDFGLPVPGVPLWSIVSSETGFYATSQQTATSDWPFIIHFDWDGVLLGQIPDPSAGRGGHARGGMLVWDDGSNSLWFSRKGPQLELLRFRPDGTLQQTVQIANIEPSSTSSKPVTVVQGGQVQVRPSLPTGTTSLFQLGPQHLVNVSIIDGDGTARYDIIRGRDGKHITTWQQKRITVAAGGGDFAIGVSEDFTDLWLYHLNFERKN